MPSWSSSLTPCHSPCTVESDSRQGFANPWSTPRIASTNSGQTLRRSATQPTLRHLPSARAFILRLIAGRPSSVQYSRGSSGPKGNVQCPQDVLFRGILMGRKRGVEAEREGMNPLLERVAGNLMWVLAMIIEIEGGLTQPIRFPLHTSQPRGPKYPADSPSAHAPQQYTPTPRPSPRAFSKSQG